VPPSRRSVSRAYEITCPLVAAPSSHASCVTAARRYDLNLPQMPDHNVLHRERGDSRRVWTVCDALGTQQTRIHEWGNQRQAAETRAF
jgi:hypothetical protein